MDKHQEGEVQEEQKNNLPETILQAFRLSDKKGTHVDVCLISKQGQNTKIRYEYLDGRSQEVEWRDLLGAIVENKRLDIVSFPKRVQKRMFKKTENRFKEVVSFSLRDSAENVEQVFSDGKIQTITLDEVKYILQEFAQQKETEMFIKIVGEHRIQKELLVFINPHSGKGQAQQVFNRVKELFEISGHRYHLVETLYRLHCFDYIYELNADKLFSYSGIVSVSGDGTPHEIINALLLRPDRERCLEMPIGAIHGGSGNALPTTMCNLSGEYSTPECAAYLIIKNQTKKLDLMEFERENKQNKSTHIFQKSQRIYSFLSLSWTYISDLDLGSESLRFLGETRFEVYGFWRLMFLNKYAANLLYSNSPQVNLPEINQPIPDQDLDKFKSEKKQLFTFFYLSNLPWVSEKYKSFPLATINDGLFDLIYLTNEQSRFQMIKTALALDNGSFFDTEKQTVAKGYDMKYEKIRSIRLEPTDTVNSGLFSIDGERYTAEPVQGTVLPNILNIYCL